MTDPQALQARVAAHLAAADPNAPSVSAVRPLAGGACQDNFRVERDGAPPLVLRSDAATSLPGSLDRAAEHAVIAAARARRVMTPAARFPAQDLVRAGASAYFLDWVEGTAIGARVTRHPSLAAARAGLVSAVAEQAARIHQVTPTSHPDLPIQRPPFGLDQDPAQAVIALIADTLDRLPAPRPGAELGLRWLRANRPAPAPQTLVHGDFRTGNFMLTPAGLQGVLDWEFCHWGDPAEDLGWLCVRDWRFGVVTQPVGGFGQRSDLLAAYTAAGGRAIEPARLHWWEVAGNLKWGAFAVMQGLRYRQGQADLELVAIPRRAAEMEFEALRLIDQGPEASR